MLVRDNNNKDKRAMWRVCCSNENNSYDRQTRHVARFVSVHSNADNSKRATWRVLVRDNNNKNKRARWRVCCSNENISYNRQTRHVSRFVSVYTTTL